jgi:hypothetical protein
MVIRLIEQISDHYRTNISNRFIRPALLQLPLDKMNWDQIEVLTEKVEQFRYQGFHLEDLYRQIIAVSRFVSIARRDLVPSLRGRLSGSTSNADRVFREMAVNNFGANLQLFADMLNELFVKLVEIDKEAAKDQKPLYSQIPELADVGHQLISG